MEKEIQDDLEKEIFEFFEKNLSVNLGVISKDLVIRDLVEDSLELFSLIDLFEGAFEVQLEYQDLINIVTIGDVLEVLRRLKGHQLTGFSEKTDNKHRIRNTLDRIIHTFFSSIIGFFYRIFFKKVFFLFDPEDVHDRMISAGKFLGRFAVTRTIFRLLFDYRHPILEQTLLGIRFRNPIGLSAGFDKNAELTDVLPDIGFGFAELGSITARPCVGNPRPRLWRLKQSRSIVVNYGLKNDGCEAIAQRLMGKNFLFPIGISVAKTNSPETVDRVVGIQDYIETYQTFVRAEIGDYFTINISCPNAFGGCPFTDSASLDLLLSEIDLVGVSRPIFIKLSPDLSSKQIDDILLVSERHQVAGFVCTNLTKNRDKDFLTRHVQETDIPDVGGMSGKVMQHLSDQLIRFVYQRTQGKKVIIGCGGVFSAEDAYVKIRSGASLVQLITGMIFEGPQLIGKINRELALFLQRDGFHSISEAIGVDAYKDDADKLV